MIHVESLSKRYGPTLALDGVSFDIAQGEIVGFLGPNGAGKTTTMRILTGYMPPSEGTATIAGHDVVEDSLAVRRCVGYMPETVPLYREMVVWDYLDFMAAVRGVRDRDAAVDRVVEACDLGEVCDRVIGRLSKGYRQRVGLAQALVHDPDVLVLDEPTIGLDPRQILSVRQLIKSLSGERTVILSSHILPEVSQVCQRVLIINRGRIVAEDTPDRLTSRGEGGQQVRMRLAQAASDAAQRLEALDGVEQVLAEGDGTFRVTYAPGIDGRADLAAFAVGQGWGLLELSTVALSLEDVFLQLTTDEEEAAWEETEEVPAE